jgi:hypothetical protein
MKKVRGKLIAPSLIVLLLIIPAGLSAKERRGADLIITRLDGSQVSGELIAVKRDSLLLLSNGRDESIDLPDIRSTRIVKKSQVGKDALYGFLVGAVGGAGVGLAKGWTNLTTYLALGVFGGAIGALSGLVVGSLAEVDSSFTVAGKPETVVAAYWDKLRAHARVPRLP